METFDQFLSFAPEVLLKIAIAVVCGGAFGMERERLGKPAGLRTNILISVGSTLYTLMSLHISGYLASGAPPSGLDARADISRIASQIVVGIGFIGAGTILRERGSVVGLTSAAMVWVMGAIGIFIGAGYIYLALAVTMFAVIVLVFLGRVEGKMLGKCEYVPLRLRFHDEDVTRREILDIMAEHEVAGSDYTMARADGRLLVTMRYCKRHPSHHRYLAAFQALRGFIDSETGA